MLSPLLFCLQHFSVVYVSLNLQSNFHKLHLQLNLATFSFVFTSQMKYFPYIPYNSICQNSLPGLNILEHVSVIFFFGKSYKFCFLFTVQSTINLLTKQKFSQTTLCNTGHFRTCIIIWRIVSKPHFSSPIHLSCVIPC